MFYDICNRVRNQYFDELQGLSPYMRQAVLFRHITEDMPLTVKDGDRIAGWYGYEDSSAPAAVDKKECAFIQTLSGEEKQLRDMLSDHSTFVRFTPAHTCIDYETVIQKGLKHCISLVDGALSVHPQDECLKAMRISLDAACNFAKRFAAVAWERAANEKDPAQKAQFEKIHAALCRVPYQGAEDFLQAVQSVWIMHSLIPMAEMSWSSISVGRMDQYLYPFYQAHLEKGGTVQQVKDILKNLFLLLDSYGDGACALNIGGMDAQGRDLTNDLSRVFIEVEKEMALRAPIFAVRITPDTPEDVWDSLIDFDLFKIGQPTFYSEENCRQAVAGRGISRDDAVSFSANSCMGLYVAGREFADMWGIRFNPHLPLELAINHGKPLHSDADFQLSTQPVPIHSFDGLMEQYSRYFTELLSLSADAYEWTAREAEANVPDPFLSALTDGCIQSRRDRATGATYNTVTVEMMGLINTCDALLAIKELVFDRKKYTLAELIAAVRADFDGCETLLHDISKCKKYGMNDRNANALCNQLCEIAAAACKLKDHDNRLFLPSLHTIELNLWHGLTLPATLDGRRKGQPVNKNANPSNLLQKTEHTSHILSAAALDQRKFSGGQPIDLYFDKAWFAAKESRDKIKALIRTYLEQGGLQLQVNSVDIPLLEKAHAHPEDHPYVIVRKGGYSVRFNEMDAALREEFISLAKRTEQHV